MKHSESKELYYKALEVFRQLQGAGESKHDFEEVRLSVDLIMNLHQQLLVEREYSSAYKLMNYCRDLVNSNDGATKKLKFSPQEITYIASHFNLFPTSIRPFISEDAELNLLLVESALRTGCHDDGDNRDSRPWAKVAERLGVLQDTDALMLVISEMHESIYSQILSECLIALGKLESLNEHYQNRLATVLIEQFERFEKDQLTLRDEFLPEILDIAKKLLPAEDFQRVIQNTPLSKIQKQDYIFKLAYVHQAHFDRERLISHALKSFDRGHLKDYSKDALSIIALAFIEQPELMHIGLKSRQAEGMPHPRAEALTANYASIVKYLLYIGKKKPHGVDIQPTANVLEMAISLVIETSHAHQIKGLEGLLEKFCGLSKEQYINLDAYRPYRRAALEKDMSL